MAQVESGSPRSFTPLHPFRMKLLATKTTCDELAQKVEFRESSERRKLSRSRCIFQAFLLLLLSCLCIHPARLSLAGGELLCSQSEVAVRETLAHFHDAIQKDSYQALLPTLTSLDQRVIKDRLSHGLPVFRVDELEKLLLGASSEPGKDRASHAPTMPAGITVTLLDCGHARADVPPLLSFRPSIYLAKERGRWRVELTKTLLRLQQPRPKEEIIAICRRALAGIAEGAELMETEHFLIFANTGPTPARTAEQLLEKLYRDFQLLFLSDLSDSSSSAQDRPVPKKSPPADSGMHRNDAAAPSETHASIAHVRGTYPYMVVFLFSYRETFRRFAAQHNPGAKGSGGYASHVGYFATWFHPAFESVVRHEGTHLLMCHRMHLFGAPNWLAEGIADTMSDPRHATVWQTKLRTVLHKGNQLSLEPLMLKQKISPGTDYLLAHSLVHFLRTKHQKEWLDLVRLIRRRRQPRPEECHAELLKLLGMSQAQLDEAWRQFVLESTPSGSEKAQTSR